MARLLVHSQIARRTVAAIVLLGVPVGCWGNWKANEAALRSAGFEYARDSFPDRYFGERAPEGDSRAEVARRMPPGATVTHYIAPSGGRDSMLLDRYVYRAALIGRWAVQIYYVQGRGVFDVYASSDDQPSFDDARRVSDAEATAWLQFPTQPATIPRSAP